MVGSGMALRVMCWVESVVDGPVMVVKVVCFGENSRELCDTVGSMLASAFIFRNHSINVLSW